ncbi:MAG TPA: hypothetical protein PK876_06820 [Elusimicrobiota bacterium]|nr:hypothetical protein [Elusimicrobiota bacterium]
MSNWTAEEDAKVVKAVCIHRRDRTSKEDLCRQFPGKTYAAITKRAYTLKRREGIITPRPRKSESNDEIWIPHEDVIILAALKNDAVIKNAVAEAKSQLRGRSAGATRRRMYVLRKMRLPGMRRIKPWPAADALRVGEHYKKFIDREMTRCALRRAFPDRTFKAILAKGLDILRKRFKLPRLFDSGC